MLQLALYVRRQQLDCFYDIFLRWFGSRRLHWLLGRYGHSMYAFDYYYYYRLHIYYRHRIHHAKQRLAYNHANHSEERNIGHSRYACMTDRPGNCEIFKEHMKWKTEVPD